MTIARSLKTQFNAAVGRKPASRRGGDQLTARPRVAPPYPTVEAMAWEPADGSRNFGDHLSSVVIAAAAARRYLTLDDEVAVARRLFGIGSILHFVQDGDVIWGTGVNGKIPLERLSATRLDVRAVRGPKTAAVLRERGHAVPDIFGDPALLVPLLFGERFTPSGTRDYVFVPNLHDLARTNRDDHLVSPLLGWNRCVAEIVSARFVASSSLHGVIIAEAFGIPARYVRLSETENSFKYDDYAQGTGRSALTPARSIEEALAIGPHPPITFDPAPLLDAFPYDLWRDERASPLDDRERA